MSAEGEIDRGSDPGVGLPRKDDSTSVNYWVAARRLDTLVPHFALPGYFTFFIFIS